MSCSFDLDHFRDLLGAARDGGYRFAFFDGEPWSGDLLLRHDVDLSLPAAVRMAEVEGELDVQATYFVMTESEFYNVASPFGGAALARLRELGHRIGLHARWPHAAPRDGFEPLVSWHNPEPDVRHEPVEVARNSEGSADRQLHEGPDRLTLLTPPVESPAEPSQGDIPGPADLRPQEPDV